MRKWCVEDWEFELTVVKGKAAHCRLGLETGDKFVFSYECPAGICPRVMMEMYTWCEVIRCGGDFTYRGEKEVRNVQTMPLRVHLVSSESHSHQ